MMTILGSFLGCLISVLVTELYIPKPPGMMPKGGFWYVYGVCSGRPLTLTHPFNPQAHLMAILLP